MDRLGNALRCPIFGPLSGFRPQCGGRLRARSTAVWTSRPDLSRLHRRWPVRRVPVDRAHDMLLTTRARQPAFQQPHLAGHDRTGGRARAPMCWTIFNASPDEYVAIFTPNASGALKLVGESYPFEPDVAICSPSTTTTRSTASANSPGPGATITYVPVTLPDLRIDRDRLRAELPEPGDRRESTSLPFPASPTSPACSIRWSGSTRRRRRAGMCCWMRPPLCRPTGWT